MAGTRRSTMDRRRATRGDVLLMRLKKAGILGGALVFTIWIGAWLHLSGSIARAGGWVDDTVLNITADMGFKVENILVEGRRYSDAEVLRAIINVERGDPLFSFAPEDAKALVERMAWVKSARIERRLPDTIYIGLTERTPLALWQKDKQLRLIDADGKIIETDGLGRFSKLMVLIGDDAPVHAHDLLENLAAEPELGRHVKLARWVDGRRWDLGLENGMEVKLPESDMGLALRRLAEAQEQDGLLEKNITAIDLREPGRIVVSTKPGAAQEYKAGLKSGNDI